MPPMEMFTIITCQLRPVRSFTDRQKASKLHRCRSVARDSRRGGLRRGVSSKAMGSDMKHRLSHSGRMPRRSSPSKAVTRKPGSGILSRSRYYRARPTCGLHTLCVAAQGRAAHLFPPTQSGSRLVIDRLQHRRATIEPHPGSRGLPPQSHGDDQHQPAVIARSRWPGPRRRIPRWRTPLRPTVRRAISARIELKAASERQHLRQLRSDECGWH